LAFGFWLLKKEKGYASVLRFHRSVRIRFGILGFGVRSLKNYLFL
jgi:hypothetical protein